jgi:phosphatidate cytidylyltransferase
MVSESEGVMTDGADEGHRPGPASDDRPPAGPETVEGVRILGAEEAQAVLEGGGVRRRGELGSRPGEVPPRPEPGRATAGTFPQRPEQARPERAERAEGTDRPEAGPPPASPPLPHWSEPPTGEIPLLGSAAETSGDLPPGERTEAPRFRAEVGDWEDAVGAVEVIAAEPAAPGPPVDVDLDDDEAFRREVERRRRLARRPARPGPPPGAVETEAEPVDLATRIVTGIAVAVVALVCLKLGRDATTVLATVIVLASAFELFGALQRRGFRPATLLGIIGSAAIVPIAYQRGEFAFPFVLAIVAVFTLLWYLLGVVPGRPVVHAASTLFGVVYVGVLGGFAGLLLGYEHGVGLVLGVAICAVGYDVVGFVVGSQFGKTPLAPTVSPHKTVEGLVGGMSASVILAVVVAARITPWNGELAHALALGLVVAVFAPLGDLCESLIKRDLGIKDFGSVLPGHGGVLDRFDAILFCLPAVYYLARALNLG